jgi:hypothetical protein
MTHRADIFRLEIAGPRWLESAATLADAKARVQELAVRSHAEYLLFDQKTGSKLVYVVTNAAKIADAEGTL